MLISSLAHSVNHALKNTNNLEHLIQSTKTDFDIIAFSEPRQIKGKFSPKDVILPNYSYEFCPTETNAGGALINIRNCLCHKKL